MAASTGERHRDVDAPKVQHKEIEVFTPDEVRRILSEACTSPLEAAYVLSVSTGMRGGEVFALRPQDYNAADGTRAIRRTLVNNGTQVGTPKSKNSYRRIQLAPVARDALERHLRNGGGEWVFPSKAGTNLQYHNFIRFHWRPLLRRAGGVEYRNFHVCRHYVVSELIRCGLPLSSIAR